MDLEIERVGKKVWQRSCECACVTVSWCEIRSRDHLHPLLQLKHLPAQWNQSEMRVWRHDESACLVIFSWNLGVQGEQKRLASLFPIAPPHTIRL